MEIVHVVLRVHTAYIRNFIFSFSLSVLSLDIFRCFCLVLLYLGNDICRIEFAVTWLARPRHPIVSFLDVFSVNIRHRLVILQKPCPHLKRSRFFFSIFVTAQLFIFIGVSIVHNRKIIVDCRVNSITHKESSPESLICSER